MKEVYVCYIWDFTDGRDYPDISEPKAIFDSEEKAVQYCDTYNQNSGNNKWHQARYWDYEVK